MNRFSEILHVDNKIGFSILWKLRVENLMRENIYYFMISRKNEEEYFDLDKYTSYGKNLVSDSVKKIMLELENLGWKVKLSFGDTGLFIYSSDEPPKTCW